MTQQVTQPQTGTNGTRPLEKTRAARELTPSVDVYENESELLIVADVPGVTAEALDLRIEPPELRIQARRQGPEPALWTRSFTIDERIDSEKVSAALEHGVLTIHLPKAEAVKPRRIAIRAAGA